MHIENKSDCTGCGACYNICPNNAITIKNDRYGFYKPFIDNEKCTNCGLCEKICPLDKYKSENTEHPKVLAFQNNDKETLYNCASGGAFAAMAKYITEQNGVVYGVIYDENMVVVHAKADNLTDLKKMYSSKYVQSNTKDTFKKAKNDLENGKTVLFSGTPCQIAGFKSYLQKDYENLITVDLICHGVPSPLVFEKYKKEFMKNFSNEEKLVNINFRSKIEGWKEQLNTTITTAKSEFTVPAKNDDFMRAFLGNFSLNESCTACQFNKLPRIADLTVADFWGVDNFDKSLNDKRGLSVIIINNEKGKSLTEKLPKESILSDVPLEFVIKYNKNICSSSVVHKKRKEFSEEIASGKTLEFCINKYDKPPFYIKVYHILPQFLKDFIKHKILKK